MRLAFVFAFIAVTCLDRRISFFLGCEVRFLFTDAFGTGIRDADERQCQRHGAIIGWQNLTGM